MTIPLWQAVLAFVAVYLAVFVVAIRRSKP